MSEKQGWEYGKSALEKSHIRISTLLNNWEYEKDGEVTHRKISIKIKMSIQTVYRHWSDFKLRILEINKNK